MPVLRRYLLYPDLRHHLLAKRPNLDKWIFINSANGMANSQIARVLGCAPSTVGYMMLPHCSKNHTRETIAFSKRRQSGIYRAAIFSVYMDFMMDRRQRGVRGFTPAMARGVVDRKLSYADIFECRLFVSHLELSTHWRNYYFRETETRYLPRNKGHTLKYAA